MVDSRGHSKVIPVVAGLVFRQGQLLITRRRAGSHLGGLWEFPGGKLESGEGLEDGLQRELREELAIEVNVGPVYREVIHHYAEKSVHLYFLRCAWLAHEPQALECDGFEWVSREHLGDFEFPAADLSLVQDLQADSALWMELP